MTVKELKNRLNKFPDEKEVSLFVEGGYTCIEDVYFDDEMADGDVLLAEYKREMM